MPKRILFLIILVVAIVPSLFLLPTHDIQKIIHFSLLSSAQEHSIEEFGKKRLAYYAKPRKVIKFAALGAWKFWDEHNIKLKDSFQFAIDKINAQNTEKKIEILWYDNDNSAKKTDDVIDTIIEQEDIFGVIGPFQSSTISVIKNKVAAAQLLHISVTQGDIDMETPRAQSYFSCTVSVFAEALAVSAWHAKKYGEKAPFILIHEDDLYSKKYAHTILRKFHNYHLNMIGSLTYERKNTTGYIQRYVNASLNFAPDVKIIFVGNAGMFSDFIHSNKVLFTAMRRSDFIINQDAITWENLKNLPNIDKSYIILNFKYDENLVKVMKELYFEADIKTTMYINALVYRMAFILSNALESAQSNNIHTVINYMNTHSLPSPLGTISFDKSGFVKESSIHIVPAKEVYDFLKKVDIGILE